MKRKNTIWISLLALAIVFAAGCTLTGDLKVEQVWARPGDQGANSAVYFIIQNNSTEADTLLNAESEIADAVELHESTIQPVDGGQGMLAKSLEDDSHEHMQIHHQEDQQIDGHMLDDQHEDCDLPGDHLHDSDHHEAHHGDVDIEDHQHEDCKHTSDSCEEGEHHDEHHPGGETSANSVETSMGMNMEGGVMTMVQQENVPVAAQSQVEFKPGGLHVMLIGLKQDLNPGDTFTIHLNFEKAGQVALDVPVSAP